jgi:hypothetical protein
MQTVLLAREIARLMTWDSNSKNNVNAPVGKVGKICQVFIYMDTLTINDVLKSVILAIIKSSNNLALSAVYDQILDDLDDDKDITFSHIQTICARQFRHTKERHPDAPHCDDTQRLMPHTLLVKTEKYNKYKGQGGHEHVVLFCDTLEQHGEQPEKVLCITCLADNDWNEPAAVTALFMAVQKYFPGSIPSDTDDDNDFAVVAASESNDSN